MKRILTILLALLLSLSLAACGQGPAAPEAGEQEPPAGDSQAETPDAPPEEPPQEPEQPGSDDTQPDAPSAPDGEGVPDAEDAPDADAGDAPDSEEPPAGESAPDQAELDALTAMLNQIRANGRVGTAGSSLANTWLAASLLDWAEGTSLTAEQGCEAAIAWFDAIPAGELDPELVDVFNAVYAACGSLMEEGQEGLLSDCGYEGEGYPWSQEALDRALGALNGVVGG